MAGCGTPPERYACSCEPNASAQGCGRRAQAWMPGYIGNAFYMDGDDSINVLDKDGSPRALV